MLWGVLVRVIMNTACEQALGWKCCNLMDMNLEVQVWNAGNAPFFMKSEVFLAGEGGAEKIDYLYPHGVYAIAPGDALSFYCSFDEDRFRRFTRIIVQDGEGKKYHAAISGEKEELIADPAT